MRLFHYLPGAALMLVILLLTFSGLVKAAEFEAFLLEYKHRTTASFYNELAEGGLKMSPTVYVFALGDRVSPLHNANAQDVIRFFDPDLSSNPHAEHVFSVRCTEERLKELEFLVGFNGGEEGEWSTRSECFEEGGKPELFIVYDADEDGKVTADEILVSTWTGEPSRLKQSKSKATADSSPTPLGPKEKPAVPELAQVAAESKPVTASVPAEGDPSAWFEKQYPHTIPQFLDKVERGEGLLVDDPLAYVDVINKEHGLSIPRTKEGLRAFIEKGQRDGTIDVVSCRKEMLADGIYGAVNGKPKHVQRLSGECYPEEPMVRYRGKSILSLFCGNVLPGDGVVAAPAPKPVERVAGQCPVYTLKLNVWHEQAMSMPGVEATHAKEEQCLSTNPPAITVASNEATRSMSVSQCVPFKGGEHVSRTHGGEFRTAYRNGVLVRSSSAKRVMVSLINEKSDEDSTIVVETEPTSVTVTGLREMTFPRTLLEKWDAIRIVFVDGNVQSPPRYERTGFRELRFYNQLPGKALGEWDNNPDRDCVMNAHGIDGEAPVQFVSE